MKINTITYKESFELVDNINDKDKVIGIFFVRKSCGACKHMIEEVFQKIDNDKIEINKIVMEDEKDNITYPPIRVPMGYFFVPNSGHIPISREGAGPLEGVKEDLDKMVSVMEGADYWEIFFPQVPDDQLPEGEQKTD